MVWLYKKELQQNLEFIADEKAQTVSDCKESYQRLLLKASVSNHPLALTNNFYNSLIKKRIIMLHKSKSKKLNQLKFLLTIPALGMIYYFKNYENVDPKGFIIANLISIAVLEAWKIVLRVVKMVSTSH